MQCIKLFYDLRTIHAEGTQDDTNEGKNVQGFLRFFFLLNIIICLFHAKATL